MKGQGKKEDAGKYGKGKGKGKVPLRKDQWACMGCGWHNFNNRASCHNWNCAHYVSAPQGEITGKGPERKGLRPKARARANPLEIQARVLRIHRIQRY